jgi:hypothetical protein
MRTDYSTERFERFLENLKGSFWGDLRGQVKQTLKEMLEVDSEHRMEEYLELRWYQRPGEEEARGQPQRVLRAGLRDALG